MSFVILRKINTNDHVILVDSHEEILEFQTEIAANDHISLIKRSNGGINKDKEFHVRPVGQPIPKPAI
jgi:hypothetical protein